MQGAFAERAYSFVTKVSRRGCPDAGGFYLFFAGLAASKPEQLLFLFIELLLGDYALIEQLLEF